MPCARSFKVKVYSLLALVLSLFSCASTEEVDVQELHVFNLEEEDAIRSFFRYTPDRIPIIGAHRGGVFDGLPENAIATYDHLLQLTHAVIEVDPRMTRDGVVVVMHDETLDRTTTGTGYVRDHTWKELQELRLKDASGKPTN